MRLKKYETPPKQLPNSLVHLAQLSQNWTLSLALFWPTVNAPIVPCCVCLRDRPGSDVQSRKQTHNGGWVETAEVNERYKYCGPIYVGQEHYLIVSLVLRLLCDHRLIYPIPDLTGLKISIVPYQIRKLRMGGRPDISLGYYGGTKQRGIKGAWI